MNQPLAIAIDGPAGAGKSTASKALAQRLGFVLIDTGAIYRVVGVMALRAGIALDDGARLGALASRLSIQFGNNQTVSADGEDLTAAIRTPEASQAASKVSAQPEVRAALLELQRKLAEHGRCVMEGRDIGTVVLPWAPLKIFLTASVEARARRRVAELQARGTVADLETTQREIEERDARDSGREHAPLKQADDAVRVDTSAMTFSQVVETLEQLARRTLSL